MEESRVNFIQNLVGKFHFIGIGGIGMSGMAEILCDLGMEVQGSDLVENDNVRRLKNKGVKVFLGHSPENVDEASYIVISSDVKTENVEVIRGLSKGIPIISRAEMLTELTRLKYTISISGSHGKTTTTSLMAAMFDNAELEPTVITGGILNSKKTNAYLGNGKYLIVEADESDGTFVKIPSFIGVVTNIDPEHLSYYGDFDALKAAFIQFVRGLPFYGFAVLCKDHKVVREIAAQVKNRYCYTYSCEDEEADVFANNIRYENNGIYYDIKCSDKLSSKYQIIKNIFLPMFGDHNVLNSLSAIVVALKLGFEKELIVNAFKGFEGVKRRFSKVGTFKGAIIIDDYAHHPEEIKVTVLTATRVLAEGDGKIKAVLQPHRYSRVESLMSEFSSCYDGVDELYLTDIYSAGESPIEGISKESLAAKIKQNYPKLTVKLVSSYDNLVDMLSHDINQGDLLLMMGAGTITKWANDLQKSLESCSS
jgi:UDP-N-acetylmuramate--alanine ligase